MSAPTRVVLSLASLVAFAALVRTQDVAEKPQPIHVEILTVAAGERVARLPDTGQTESGEAVPFKLVGRRIAWRVEGKRVETRDAFELELANAVAARQARRGEAADASGSDMVLTPDDGAVWDDVVVSMDCMYGAGCNDLQLADTGPFPIALLPKSVTYPVREGGAIVVAAAMFQEPDESDPPDYWRPMIVVRQDRRTEYRGRTVIDAARPDASVEALRDTLRGIAERALAEHGLRDGGPADRKQLKGRLMIHADKWARWRDVQRVLQEATRLDPAFWMFDLALTDPGEPGLEERLAKGERF